MWGGVDVYDCMRRRFVTYALLSASLPLLAQKSLDFLEVPAELAAEGVSTSEIRGVSADGRIAVGTVGNNRPAYLDLETGEVTLLPESDNRPTVLPSSLATASGITPDGKIIFGRIYTEVPGGGEPIRKAAFWSGPDYQDLTIVEGLPGNTYSAMIGMSADGRIGVGFSRIDENVYTWRWDAETGIERISPLPETIRHDSFPAHRPISRDGQVLLFDQDLYQEDGTFDYAVTYYTVNDAPPQRIPYPPAEFAPPPESGDFASMIARSLSENGRFLVGAFFEGSGYHGYVFDRETGEVLPYAKQVEDVQRGFSDISNDGEWALITDFKRFSSVNPMGVFTRPVGSIIHLPTEREMLVEAYLTAKGYTKLTPHNHRLTVNGILQHANERDMIVHGSYYDASDSRYGWTTVLEGGFDLSVFPENHLWDDYRLEYNRLYRNTSDDAEPGIGWIYDAEWPYVYSFALGEWLYFAEGSLRRSFTAYRFGEEGGSWIWGSSRWG